MTRNPVEGMGFGDRTGRLAPDLSADFIVLDRDLYAAAPRDSAGTKVLKAYLAGEEVSAASS